MPTISDYLQQSVNGVLSISTGLWVQLVNNATSVAYVSTAATDTTGKFTVNNVPAGTYTLNTGPTASGAWTATGDGNYQVQATAGDGTSTFPGAVTVPSLAVSGGQAGRYVVNNAAFGAPTAGAHLVGDWTISNASGSVFVCTVAGTPGTWRVAGDTFNVFDFGAKGDGVTKFDGVVNAASAVLTSASGTFTAADVGKLITVNGAGAAGVPLNTTIASFQSVTQVTLAVNATTSVAVAQYCYGTDDGAAITAALNAAVAGTYPVVGGQVVAMRATFMTSTRLVVPFRVQFCGSGRESTTIKASGAFPINTEVVRLGDLSGGIGMACRLVNVAVDASGISGSTCVYSERINEQSGVYFVLAMNPMAYGVRIGQPGAGQPPQNYTIEDVEVLWTGGAVGLRVTPPASCIGLAVDQTSSDPARTINKVSVVSNWSLGVNLTTAIRLDGTGCRISDIHVEGCTNGLLVGSVTSCSPATFINITCWGPTTTNLIVLSSAVSQNHLAVIGASAIGATTNLIVDNWSSVTVNDFNCAFYVQGNGSAGANEVLTSALGVTQRFGRVKMLKDLQRSSQNIAYVAAITPDASAGEIVIVGVLTGGLTINAPTNAVAGQKLTFVLTQDATGSRSVTWNAVFKTVAQPPGDANSITLLTFLYDGTSWQQIGPLGMNNLGNFTIPGTLYLAGSGTFASSVSYQKDLRRSKQSPAFNATPAPDPTLGEIYEMAALTGAVAVANPVNAAQGQRIRFYWKQDGTGGRAVTYPGSNFRSVGIAAQVTTASTYTIDEAECLDGTIWRVVRLVTGQTV